MQRGTDPPTPEAVEEMVRKAQQGDAAAFADLYQSFYDRIFRYVRFKTGDTTDAEDLTEEVFLKMLESIGSFKWKGFPFTSWLFRIAHNLVVDHFRKKGRRKVAPLEQAKAVSGASADDVDDRLDVKLSVQQVYKAMGGLTELQKEVISLRFTAGMSLAETAQAMDKKQNAIKALQHAAIKKLRTLLVASPTPDSERALPQWSR